MTFNFSDSANVGKEYNGFILLSVDDLPDYKDGNDRIQCVNEGMNEYLLW